MTAEGAFPVSGAEHDLNGTVKSHSKTNSKSYGMPTERTPLLPDSIESGQVEDLSEQHHDKSTTKLVVILFASLLLVSCGDQLVEYANVKIYESIICYRFYEKHNPRLIKIGRDHVGPGALNGVDEMWCKADPVAAELATLLGYQQLFDGLPAMLLSLPFGWLADRYGRWPFLFAGLCGLSLRALWMQIVMWNWQAFDLRWAWLSAASMLPAGGSFFLTTMFFVVSSDITTPDNRAAIFFRIGAINNSASLLMPPLVAWSMEYSPWIPTFAGSALMALAAGLYLLIPETLNFQPQPADSSDVSPTHVSEQPIEPDTSGHTGFRNLAMVWIHKLKTSTSFLTHDWRIPALILPFFIYTPIAAMTQLELQYISKRYLLKLSQATFIITIREAVHLALLFVILPYLSTVLLRVFNNSAQAKDLFLLRASQLIATAGLLLAGLSPNVPMVILGFSLAVLGQGASIVDRSFVTTLLQPQHVARVFALMGILSGCGQVLGAPVLAWLFKRGMALGGTGVGLPFIVVGIICGGISIMFLFIRLYSGEGVSPESEEAMLTAEDEP